MEYLLYPSIAIVVIALIKEVAKIVRISQLKNLDSPKIKSIGKYEKNSKIKNSSVLSVSPKSNNQ